MFLVVLPFSQEKLPELVSQLFKGKVQRRFLTFSFRHLQLQPARVCLPNGKDKAKRKEAKGKDAKGKGSGQLQFWQSRPDTFTSASYRDRYEDWYAVRSNHGPGCDPYSRKGWKGKINTLCF